MREIEILPLDWKQFEPLLNAAQRERFAGQLANATKRLEGRTLWHVNSTATGGGVAEMLQSVLGYLVDAGINTRWMVIEGDDEFFVITKRIHNWLHGSRSDDGPLGELERSAYETCLKNQAGELIAGVNPGDVVVLHDPQAIGLAPELRAVDVPIIWSCHVGVDEPSMVTRAAWEFLIPYVHLANRAVFSRRSYAWDLLNPEMVEVVSPCIDAFSPKNQHLDHATIDAILGAAGIIPSTSSAPAIFHRPSGDEAKVTARALMMEEFPIPDAATLVTQVSRWDHLKDHLGVMRGFTQFVPEGIDAHLVLAGPSPESVADDPEGAEVLDELRREWGTLENRFKARVHIACLPMDDLEENGAIVNALQRRSQVIVQKSLAEGFGLTVAEAMWKEVPTLASAVGGIKDQIRSGANGVLIDDPGDLEGFGRALTALLEDPMRARQLGREAHLSVQERYLAPNYLTRLLEMAVAVS